MRPGLRRWAARAALGLALTAPAGAGAFAACESAALPGGVDFVAATARNLAAVVSLISVRLHPSQDDENGYEYFPLTDTAPAAIDTPERSTASGFVLEADGHILTSAHAVRHAQELWVVLADGRRLRADVVGSDRRTDVALLKVDAWNLPVVRVARDAPLCPGEPVAALGAPFGFERSVTAGVVSANPRVLPGSAGVGLIQTDVALNPGSSGGPLFNTRGEVVGMNSMIFSSTGIYVGVSFAVPIDRVLRTAADLRLRGRADRGHAGARAQPVTPLLAEAFGLPDTAGALLVQVESGGPAAQAGLRPGDIVRAVDGAPLASSDEFEDRIEALPAGGRADLQVWRGRRSERVTLRVGAPPVEAGAPARRPAAAEVRLGLVFAPALATQRLPAGLYVDTASGSALLAGIETGDRITAVNGVPVATLSQFDEALKAADKDRAGAAIALLVVRGQTAAYIGVPRGGLR
jgi:serine protease Do